MPDEPESSALQPADADLAAAAEATPARRLERALGGRHGGLIVNGERCLPAETDEAGEAVTDQPTRDALARLAERLAVVAVVGVGAVHGLRHLVAVQDILYLGNHGVSRMYHGRSQVEEGGKEIGGHLARAYTSLQTRLAGMDVEIIDHGLGIELRPLAQLDRSAATRIVRAIDELSLPRTIEAGQHGRSVMLRPSPSGRFGMVMRLQRQYQLDGIVYLGALPDDREALAALPRLACADNVVTIGVGDAVGFDWAVADAAAAAALLRTLAAHGGRPRRDRTLGHTPP